MALEGYKSLKEHTPIILADELTFPDVQLKGQSPSGTAMLEALLTSYHLSYRHQSIKCD